MRRAEAEELTKLATGTGTKERKKERRTGRTLRRTENELLKQ
jgi:hypothetical protein